ncbi:hypothetical protein Pmar_PMAR009146 [Perkinsus marinus ATCC 50983]|uniref:Tail specific protease domain-containing protein n=1 Tax=Perkinsus marinus (strain ATCC 50983 / TXsc) TaxID=423536 RepID=C5KBK0_PERM5|nr:hypothetical protein Pmar_PMAR009146 [Perkinsus marinus ATCC 50983]EER18120.1 hypothetical protein Pmar_PMAR009146 [Perkinsus marinus ATCC 50983]|eukprot:XP_002786324.1 hypothetical protein Pmar_PMAR009146 [Perkinsus marinus ATCC 50983]
MVHRLLLAHAALNLLVAGQPSSPDWDQFCRDALQRESYCMPYKVGEGRVCYGSEPPLPCGPSLADDCAALHPSAGRTILQDLPGDPMANYVWGRAEDVNECLETLTITNFDALFTLHNLKYGLSETYAFTDIANGLKNSAQSNTCGFLLHDLDVDIKSFFDKRIEEYSRILKGLNYSEQKSFLGESIPATTFHLPLQRELNRLNDAHTRYEAPFTDFYYVLPIRFDSRMQDGMQVVTLGFPDLPDYYPQLYGGPATSHKEGDIITQVDGTPVLQWMQNMVADDGPYVGIYQGSLQRLNNRFFVRPYVDRYARTEPPPTGPLNVTFSDGSVETIHWLGRLTDFSKGIKQDAVNLPFLNARANTNPFFEETVKLETELYSKCDSLWHLMPENSRDASLTAGLDSIFASEARGRWDDDLFRADGGQGTGEDTFVQGIGYEYALVGDAVVVYVPNFEPDDGSSSLSALLYGEFPEVQDFAKQHNVTRLLFDLSSNGGGFILSAFALQWYFAEAKDICFPIVRHMTDNWQLWVSSFGVNYDEVIDGFFSSYPEIVGDPVFIHGRFEQLYELLSYADSLLSDSDTPESELMVNQQKPWLNSHESSILSLPSAPQRAEAFKRFLKERQFLDPSQPLGAELAPKYGWFLFDNSWLVSPLTGKRFEPPLSQFTEYRSRTWGKESNYSAEAIWELCPLYLNGMRQIAGPDYDKNYWSEVAFVTDGNCGSACSMFTQTLQLSGIATAFTFGALADQPMDVASFGGGDEYEYDEAIPLINIASHLGHWATLGQSEWSRRYETSWVNKPVPFPNSARVKYTWNGGLTAQLGPESLPRQFYIIPPHKHLNMWARNSAERAAIYEEIVSIKSWTELRKNPQFPDMGSCPTYVKKDPSESARGAFQI